jgi:hypothetical protein
MKMRCKLQRYYEVLDNPELKSDIERLKEVYRKEYGGGQRPVKGYRKQGLNVARSG